VIKIAKDKIRLLHLLALFVAVCISHQLAWLGKLGYLALLDQILICGLKPVFHFARTVT
jgi:hypothetical protein